MPRPLSRRLFILSSLAVLAAPELSLPGEAKRRPRSGKKTGPRSIAREDWPPAIVPDHVGVTGKTLVCLSDESGRLALVDFKRVDKPGVVGELSGFAKRLMDFLPAGSRAYALALQDSAAGEPEYVLVSISLAPSSEPSVMSRTMLGQYSEPSCLTVNQDLICIGGTATNGGHLVSVYRRGRGAEPTLVSSFAVEQPIVRIDLQDRHLVILQGPRNSQLDYVNLYYPTSPQIRKTIKLDGDYPCLARLRQNLFVAGQPAGSSAFEVKALALEPAPHAVSSITLGDVNAVLDMTVRKGQVLVLRQRGAERELATIAYDKALDLTAAQTLALPGGTGPPGASCRLTVRERVCYIASGWAGVDVIALDKGGWKHAFTYSIPRLPASGVVSSGDLVVLAGADLKLYSVAKPDKPVLMLTAEADSTIRSIAAAGSYVLCLAQGKLTLRKMESLKEVLAAFAVTGEHMAYDGARQKAYVLSRSDKKTLVTPLKVYSNSVVPEKALAFGGSFRRIAADNGYLLLRTLNDLELYRVDGESELVGKRHLDNLAIRDAWLGEDYILATAVDHRSRGFLMVLSRQEPDLKSIGVVDLPQDGVAVAFAQEKAVVVGRSLEGQDTVSIVSLASPATPRVLISLPVVEAASAVTIKDDLAFVAGRGLEIVSLS